MWLETVDKEPGVTEGVGWKTFRRGSLETGGGFRRVLLREDEWTVDTAEGTIEGKYTTGFHIWRYSQGAQQWKISGEELRKVSFRRVVATGRQTTGDWGCRGGAVIVAREIYIHPVKW